ncbi:MAG: hypothetical protein ACKVU4_10350 [Phycisphaerales bacterium]
MASRDDEISFTWPTAAMKFTSPCQRDYEYKFRVPWRPRWKP